MGKETDLHAVLNQKVRDDRGRNIEKKVSLPPTSCAVAAIKIEVHKTKQHLTVLFLVTLAF